MVSRKLALILASITALIYGVSFTVAKDVMPQYIKPFGFIMLRVFGATILFWITSFFIKKESITKRDFIKIFIAAIFGVALNMLTFFKGLSLTTPISGAVIMVTTPILVLILSSVFLKEKTTLLKIIGVIIGLFGASILILYGKNFGTGNNAILGNFLVFVNATSYAFYLILIKNLTKKYNPLHLAKWLYTFGLVMVTPFGINQLKEVQLDTLTNLIILKIIFIIVFTTFITYLFNLIAIKKLKPTTVSIFIYLQPVFATIYALSVKSDSLNSVKIIATLFIFVGVYLVTKPKKPTTK